MGGKGSGGARARAGTQRSPEFIARAVKLAADLGSPKEAAAQLTREGTPVHWRSIYNWQNGEKGARKAGVKPRPRRDVSAAGRGTKRTRNIRATAGPSGTKVAAPDPPPAPVVAEEPPKGVSARALRRWHIEKQIEAVRTALALVQSKIESGDPMHLSRVGTLNKELRSWLDALAELEGPEQEDPHAEERRWERAATEAVKKIRDGCADARERMAALIGRPFPYAA